MFNLDDYYLGLIFVRPEYFSNPERKRVIWDVSFDPFHEVSPDVAMIFGKVVLLKKKDDIYYDEYYSRYPNELAYKLGEDNKLGIKLVHVKPFAECYHEEVNIFVEEDVFKDSYMALEMLEHSYYVIHSKLKKSDAIVINCEEPMEIVRHEYFKDLLGLEMYDKVFSNKTLEKVPK